MLKLIDKGDRKILIFEDENGIILIRDSKQIEDNYNAKTLGK